MLAAILLTCSVTHAEVAIDLGAIKIIESSGNPHAYNAKTRCYGLYQISEICLKDYNQRNKKTYRPDDLFNPLINEKIASWYFERIVQMLHYFKIPVSITTRIASYHWGIGNVTKWHAAGAHFEKLPKATQHYIARYRALTNPSARH